MVRPDILQKFPELFGKKQVNGREVDVDETITTLTRELSPAIAAALTARRELLASPAPVADEVRVAGAGTSDLRGPGEREAVDLPPDRPGARRQLPGQGQRPGAGASTTRRRSPSTFTHRGTRASS